MPTFRYNPAPKTGSGFTTRPILAAEIDVPALDAAVAAETGVPVEKVPLVLKAYLQRFLAAAADGGYATGVHGMIRFRPTSGGSKPHPDDFHNAEEINADVALSFTIDTIREWRSTLSIESGGTLGKVTPQVDTVINRANGQLNHYTPGKLVELVGENLRFDEADLTQGVFFKPGAGAEVRADTYGINDPATVDALVPATLAGPLTLRIAAFINGSVRSYTYTVPLVTP